MMRCVRFVLAVTLSLPFLVNAASGADILRTGKGKDVAKVSVRVTSGDPFDATNALKASAEPMKIRRGEIVRVQVHIEPVDGFHTYPLTRRTADQRPEQLSRVVWTAVKGIRPLWPTWETDPHVKDEKELRMVLLEHDKPFMWAQDFVVLPEIGPGKVELPLRLEAQFCRENCEWIKHNAKVSFIVSEEPAASILPEVLANLETSRPDPFVVPVESPYAKAPSTGEKSPSIGTSSEHSAPIPAAALIQESPEEYKATMEKLADQFTKKGAVITGSGGGGSDQSLLAFMLAGVLWGGISLVTPCVFPMIPITVSFFLKQSEKEHHKPIVMASIYSATIVIVLTLAAAFLLTVFRDLSVNPILNYAMGVLFIYFALSLFGMYEIELPSFLSQYTYAKQEQGGFVGTIFMALTFTIISFTCVAPFLGGFGGTTAANRPLWHNLLGGLAFSATFASPFFFLALFPSMLRGLPKSGSWLNVVKVVMGFLELAAALKFFRAAELVAFATPWLFTFDFVLSLWVALCVLCGLYLVGVFRLPHDTPEDHIGVPRLVLSVVFLGIAFHLAPALWKSEDSNQRPNGTIYAWVDSFLLPDLKAGDVTGNLSYALQEARDKRKRVFLDFTGINCTNCKLNERNVFSKPDFRKAFGDFVVAQIYTDSVPDFLYSPENRAKMAVDGSRRSSDAKVNEAFQKAVFDDITLPLYAIVEPTSAGVKVLGINAEGRITDEPAFLEFLRNPNKR